MVRPVKRTSSTTTTVLEFEREREFDAVQHRLPVDLREVVTVEGDVEPADGRPYVLVGGDRVGEPLGERHAPALDADERQ